MNLTAIVDQMIDQAHENDPADSYTILLGIAPLTSTEWVRGKKIYRWFPVAQTRLVPNYLVVLAPSPDNYRSGRNLFEFHGRIEDGQITRFTIRHNTRTIPRADPKPHPPRLAALP